MRWTNVDTWDRIEVVLRLLKTLEDVKTVPIRILITGRRQQVLINELSTDKKDSDSALAEDVQLEAAQANSIGSDLRIFFEHEFQELKKLIPARNSLVSLS